MVLTGVLVYLLFSALFVASTINLVTSIYFKKEEKHWEDYEPSVSVVIRSWNDGKVVERCINNLLSQDYPKEKYEIVIADDGSQDNTERICREYEKKGLIKYCRLPRHENFKAKVIDTAIKRHATGEIILESDIDAIHTLNWIKEMVKPFSDKKVGGVSGIVVCGNWYRPSWIIKLRAIEDFWQFCASLYGRYKLTKQGFLYGGSKAYLKGLWKEIGGHPTSTMIEDGELAAKIIEKGYKIAIVKTPTMQEEVETLKQYISERKRWTGGDLELAKNNQEFFFENPIEGIVTVANHGIDIVNGLAILLSFSNILFLIPVLINALAIKICMNDLKSKLSLYFWVLPYVFISPFLQLAAAILYFYDKTRKMVRWEKVWHYPTPLRWPIELKVIK